MKANTKLINNSMPKKIEISHRTIVFSVIFLIFIWFLYYISDILLQFFVALLITAILNPMVYRLSKLKIPRPISIVIAYVVVIGIVSAAIAGVVPPLVEQTSSFANRLPEYVEEFGGSGIFADTFTTDFLGQLSTLPSQVARFTVSIFSNVLAIITVLIFAFYLLLSRDGFDSQLEKLLGEQRAKVMEKVVAVIEVKLGRWARGQLALMFVVGLLTYLGLVILGIPFAIPLSIIAGLLEIIPYMGPIIAAVPTVIVGFSMSPVIGFSAGVLAFVVQTLENYLFVPKIMEKSVGTSPVATIFALLVGLRLAGPTGAVIAIPVLITSQVLISEYFSAKK